MVQEVIVRMCCGEACSFTRDAVCVAVRAFLHYALPWQMAEAPHTMDPALAWVCSFCHTQQQN